MLRADGLLDSGSDVSTLAKDILLANYQEVNFRAKIIARQSLMEWCKSIRTAGKRLVVTNGCFDLLHVGHVSYLEQARNLGDALLVGVNGDNGVRQLKGPARPVNPQEDRAAVLAALESVTAVCIFEEATANNFLIEAMPDIYAKGGDYTLETINQEERRLVENLGGKVQIVRGIAGKSTTALLERIWCH